MNGINYMIDGGFVGCHVLSRHHMRVVADNNPFLKDPKQRLNFKHKCVLGDPESAGVYPYLHQGSPFYKVVRLDKFFEFASHHMTNSSIPEMRVLQGMSEQSFGFNKFGLLPSHYGKYIPYSQRTWRSDPESNELYVNDPVPYQPEN